MLIFIFIYIIVHYVYLSPYVQKTVSLHLSCYFCIGRNRNSIHRWYNCGVSWKPYPWSYWYFSVHGVIQTSWKCYKEFCFDFWESSALSYIYYRTSYTLSDLRPYFLWVLPVHPWWTSSRNAPPKKSSALWNIYFHSCITAFLQSKKWRLVMWCLGDFYPCLWRRTPVLAFFLRGTLTDSLL